MKTSQESLIFALATPPGKSALGVLRLSGEGADALIARVFTPARGLAGGIEARKMQQGILAWPIDHKIVDEILLCRFQAPHSYTGEDLYEIFCHGNPVIIRGIYELFQSQGARVAEPGEFTKRAFVNGKMDLIQAEAVGEMIQADSTAALGALRQQYSGVFSEKITVLRQQLVDLLAWIEADIDFGDREVDDVAAVDALNCRKVLQNAFAEAGSMLSQLRASEKLRGGFSIVLAGRPNVGKSSLFNALCGEDRALVDDLPGTTRDYLEARLELAGYPCRLIDTAGMRDAEGDRLEAAGVRRSKQWLEKSDLILAVFDRSASLTDEDRVFIDDLLHFQSAGKKIVLLVNKSDLQPGAEFSLAEFPSTALRFEISVRAGEGLAQVMDGLRSLVQDEFLEAEQSGEKDALYLSARQGALLVEVAAALQRLLEGDAEKLGLECLTYDLRVAVNSLSRLLGREISGDVQNQESEEVLDRVFTAFCIGK